MRDARYIDGLLSTREAARLLGIRPRTLEHWRRQRTGPTYSKIGRAIRYSRGALEKYISDHEYLSESELTEILSAIKLR
jgi:excisionase family DNA binding protein